jgi:hypothetical protein
MDFRVPRDLITNRFLTAAPTQTFRVSVALQGLGDEEKVVEEEFSIGGSSGEFPADDVLFPGNGFRSVRGLMQRLGKLCLSAATTNAAAHFLAFPYGGVAPISSAVGTYANWIPVVTFQGWYSPLFSTIAGGMRCLIVFPSSGSISSMVSAGMFLNIGGLPLDGS